MCSQHDVQQHLAGSGCQPSRDAVERGFRIRAAVAYRAPHPTRDGRGGTPDAVVSVSPSYVRAPRKRCKSLVEPVCGTVLPLQRSPLRGLASLLGRHGSCPPKLADLLTTRPASMRS